MWQARVVMSSQSAWNSYIYEDMTPAWLDTDARTIGWGWGILRHMEGQARNASRNGAVEAQRERGMTFQVHPIQPL